ncbi:MAG: hypothetical protein ACM359_22955 [Bacillota bacterium]
MTEPFTIFFLFMGVIAITAIIFGIWVVVSVIKLIFHAFCGLFRLDPAPRPVLGPTIRCPRRGCHASNPVSARFCRRCGRELLKSEIGHTAMW